MKLRMYSPLQEPIEYDFDNLTAKQDYDFERMESKAELTEWMYHKMNNDELILKTNYKEKVEQSVKSNLMMFTGYEIVSNDDEYYNTLAEDLIDDNCMDIGLKEVIAKEFKALITAEIFNTDNDPVWIFSSEIADLKDEIERLKQEIEILRKNYTGMKLM